MSKIEWTDRTWNPVTGCTKVSPGCKNCYAERMSERLKKMGLAKYQDAFTPRLHWDVLDEPSRWKKPSRIFVCSMSDLFQAAVPDRFIRWVLKETFLARQHQYQVLTKRAARMEGFFRELAREREKKNNIEIWGAHPHWTCPPLTNVWIGVSAEDQDRLGARVDYLVEAPGPFAARFLSVEPMLGPVRDIPAGIDWVICGGESGPGARPMDPAWARALRDECQDKRIPFFFKQWGGTNKKRAGRELDGRTWDEMPEGM